MHVADITPLYFLKKYFVFQSSFRFTAKLGRRSRNFLNMSSPTIDTPQSGTFVTIEELTLTHHHPDPLSLVCPKNMVAFSLSPGPPLWDGPHPHPPSRYSWRSDRDAVLDTAPRPWASIPPCATVGGGEGGR